MGSKVKIELWTSNGLATHSVCLETTSRLVPCFHGLDAFPSYVIYGGCVFAPLSMPLVEVLETASYDDMATYPTASQVQTGGVTVVLCHYGATVVGTVVTLRSSMFVILFSLWWSLWCHCSGVTVVTLTVVDTVSLWCSLWSL